MARAAGRDIGAGVVVLDIDSTIVIAHSDKEGAAATYKHSYVRHEALWMRVEVRGLHRCAVVAGR
uniref:hypothetical protein n=1 Tax=Salinispora pacifica TaxID=351187 RepID=UPI0003694DC4|nr:hypothetical protein [Salinispora pacifica]